MYFGIGGPLFVGALLLLSASASLPWPLSVGAIWLSALTVLLTAFLLWRSRTHWHGSLRMTVAHALELRGGVLIIWSVLGPRRVELADIIAFDRRTCTLVTRTYQVFRLAPTEAPAYRVALAAILDEHFAAQPGGSIEDVPAALQQCTARVLS